jgi:hypothetical protein
VHRGAQPVPYFLQELVLRRDQRVAVVPFHRLDVGGDRPTALANTKPRSLACDFALVPSFLALVPSQPPPHGLPSNRMRKAPTDSESWCVAVLDHSGIRMQAGPPIVECSGPGRNWQRHQRLAKWLHALPFLLPLTLRNGHCFSAATSSERPVAS